MAAVEVVPGMMMEEGAPDLEEMEVKRWGWSWDGGMANVVSLTKSVQT
jgi:hypothetical protein